MRARTGWPVYSTWRPSIDDGGSLERPLERSLEWSLESPSGSTWRPAIDDGGSLEQTLNRGSTRVVLVPVPLWYWYLCGTGGVSLWHGYPCLSGTGVTVALVSLWHWLARSQSRSIDDGGSLERSLESPSGSTWRLSTDDGGSLERPLERPLERSLYLVIYTLLSLFLLVSVRLKKGYYRP